MLVALDTETTLIRAYHYTPELVCVSYATDGDESGLLHCTDKRTRLFIRALLEDEDCHFTGANIAYDFRVLVNFEPDWWTLIWDAYYAGRIHDVVIREKLLTLSTTGDIGFRQNADGTKHKLLWNLAEVERSRLGVDRSEEKKDSGGWRLRYGELIDTPIWQWPHQAFNYALEDAVNPLAIHQAQEEQRQPRGHYGSMEMDPFQAAADFALGVFTSWGVATDPARVADLSEHLEEILSAERMGPLYELGILRPAEPPRPYKNNPEKFTKGVKESKDAKKLRKLVEAKCKEHSIKVHMTDTKLVSTNADTLQQIAKEEPKDSPWHLLLEREKHIKLRSTYLPVLQHPRVWFPFNVLVSSGRTSSRGSEGVPSSNGQNQPRLKGDFSVRECYVPDPGWVFLASDFGMLELCTCAQQIYNLFGQSTHRDLINSGVDLHAYLGAQLARYMEPNFSNLCERKGFNPMAAYEAFLAFKTAEDPELKAFFKHWRTFAKPTGLGYPGGLGPATFIDYARGSYGIEVDFPTAKAMRNVWFKTFPEMREYFDWCSNQVDDHNVRTNPKDPEDVRTLYMYSSPMGMLRVGAAFTEMANGFALQTPAGEGAKTAVISVGRACTDPAKESELFGCHPINFIHDEIITAIPDDDRLHEKAIAQSDIMIASMSNILTDVKATVENTLMNRWYKDAEPVFDDEGRLVVWEPGK